MASSGGGGPAPTDQAVPPAAAQASSKPVKVGQYHLLQTLGTGSFGKVKRESLPPKPSQASCGATSRQRARSKPETGRLIQLVLGASIFACMRAALDQSRRSRFSLDGDALSPRRAGNDARQPSPLFSVSCGDGSAQLNASTLPQFSMREADP